MAITHYTYHHCRSGSAVRTRIEAIDRRAMTGELDAQGCTVVPKLLTEGECREIGLYDGVGSFRSKLVMERHGFGQRPRMQSRASVVPLRRGDGVIFAMNQRPVRGSRGFYRTVLRHGVSRIRTGRRHTVGIIFHDAALSAGNAGPV